MVPLSSTSALERGAGALEATAAASDLVTAVVKGTIETVVLVMAAPVRAPVDAGVAIGTPPAEMPEVSPVTGPKTSDIAGGTPDNTAAAEVAVGPSVAAVFSKHKQALDNF